jgi:hypothetical protein
LPDVDDVDILYDSFVRSFNAACSVCSHTLRVNERHFHARKWVDAELINSARLRQNWFGKLKNDRLKREYRTARNIYTRMKRLKKQRFQNEYRLPEEDLGYYQVGHA